MASTKASIVDLLGLAQRPGAQQRPAAEPPIDLLFGNLRVKDVAGKIEIDRPGLAAHRLLEGGVHLFGNALQIVNAVRPFGARLHDRDLVDLLEDLPAELPDRARTADRHHWRAVDQCVGDARGEIDHSRTARRHADARLLQQPAVGLSHQRRRLLVAHVQRTDALFDAGRFRQQHGPAHEEEQDVRALALERFCQDFRTRELRHRHSPFK
jgi:hypothetical protein